MEADLWVKIIGTAIAFGVGINAFFSRKTAKIIGEATIENARRQAENAEAKLRLDLFEKRFEQYTVISDVFTYVFRHARIEPEAIPRLHRARQICRFLFDESVGDYIYEIIKSAAALERNQGELDHYEAGGYPNDKRRLELLEENEELVLKFYHEPKAFNQKFTEYMRILPVAEKDSSKVNEHRRFGWLLSRTGGGKSELNGD